MFRALTADAKALAAALLAAAATHADAVVITNNSGWTYSVSVIGSGIAPRGLGPNSSTEFNLLGDQNGIITVRVVTPGAADATFGQEIIVQAHRGGSVVIDQQPLHGVPHGGPGNPYAVGYATSGAEIDIEPNNADLLFRSVAFTASSDCQFCTNSCDPSPDLAPEEMFAVPHLTNTLMGLQINDSTGFRGAIMAGDLTQFAEINELNAYKSSIAGYERHMFDGLGNHDVDLGRTRVSDYVRDRRRGAMRLANGANVPHYSWNWHDIHFVQANIFPANAPDPRIPIIDPGAALAFIQADLAANVGNSGRPVVIVHHYGFESFSADWWNADQKQQYWDVIKDYNIVLILTGHVHYGDNRTLADRRRTFDGDGAGVGVGRDGIPCYNVGASRFGAWAEIEFNARNQIRISMKDRTDAVRDTTVIQHKTPVWVNASYPDTGFGWGDAPFSRIELGIIARHQTGDLGPTANTNNIPLNIAPGNYNEQLTIRDAMVLEPDRPGSIVIGRP